MRHASYVTRSAYYVFRVACSILLPSRTEPSRGEGLGVRGTHDT